MAKIGVALYGSNGHQVQQSLVDHPRAQLVAIAAMTRSQLPEPLRQDRAIAECGSLEEVLRDGRVKLVSLCSPRRRDQAQDAIRCLAAGRHVYAEKPCAMTEADLDAILDAVGRTGMQFREMANGIAEQQPYLALRRAVESGQVGRVVQVLAQKSYPYHEGRPDDEDVDGGLIGQNAGHALRMIEQVAGQRITWIDAVETRLGKGRDGDLRMAASITMRLEGGGVASAIANYLNPRPFGSWGNEHLRVFGTRGMAEITDGGARTRLVREDRDCGPLDTSEPSQDYLDMLLASLEGGPMPRKLADELHVTRMAIRAKAAADARDRAAGPGNIP